MKIQPITLLLFSMLLPFAYKCSHAQIIGKTLGVESNALAQISSLGNIGFQSYHNPALMNQAKKLQLGLSQELPFLQSNLAISAIHVQKNLGYLCLGAGFVEYGNAYFKQQVPAIQVGKQLSDHVQLGIAFRWVFTSQYQDKAKPQSAFSVGAIIKPQSAFSMGVYGLKMVKTANSSLLQPTGSFIRMGIAYRFDPKLTAYSEYELQHTGLRQFKLAFDYKVHSKFRLMGGCVFPRYAIAFGASLTYKQVVLSIGTRLHPQLGLSEFSELQFQKP